MHLTCPELFGHIFKASLPTLLTKHKQRLHSERARTHLCNICGNTYMEKTHLWSHIAYSHGNILLFLFTFFLNIQLFVYFLN